MSLTASMWTSVSGLLVHGEKMNVIGNNISNVNTVGFKGDRMDFQDFISQEIGTAAGMGQVGRGTGIGIVMKNWQDGSFETTTDTTDIAIAGNGLFKVIPKNSNTEFYTRAGNFRFDKDGFLTDPHGYVLQGWKVDNSARSLAAATGAIGTTGSSIIGSGVPVDIRLDTFNCDPKHTNNVTLAVNLDSANGNNKTSNDDYPFFSMLNLWDATPNAQGKIDPLSTQARAHAQQIEVFDEGGQSHKLTVYFDRVTQTPGTNIDNLKESEIVWEYMVTMDPAEDLRNLSDNPVNLLPDKYKGLLMSGTMTFDSSGQLRDQTAYVPTDNDMGDLNTWVKAPLSSNGYPMVAPNFSGRDGASTAWDMSQTPPIVNQKADGFLIEMNFGLRSQSPNWDPTMPNTIGDWTGNVTTGGFANVHKVVKDAEGKIQYYQKSTVAPANYPAGGNATSDPANTIPAFPVSTLPLPLGEALGADGTSVVLQKKASQGIKDHEAKGKIAPANGYVFEQLTGTHPDGYNGEIFYDTATPANTYVLDVTTNLYYPFPGTAGDAGQTAAQLVTAGVTLAAEPDLTKAVATSTPSPTNIPKFIVDAGGNPIQATVTSTQAGMGVNAEKQNTTSTSYTNNTGNNFYERFANQDGYTYGELRYVTVGADGVMSAAYSNGQSLELYQISLYDFPSKQNLRREGGNLFTETRDSGLALQGAAGTGSFGTTQSNTLELSNVDLAREFVNMITTQKGFQANSKSITTVDTMLDSVIQMKR